MIDKYTAQAPTKDQAIEKGLQALGIAKDEAIIEVTVPGKKGFLGFGQQDAVVTVKRKEKTSVVEDVFAENPLKESVLSASKEPEKESFVSEEDEPTVVKEEESVQESEVIEPVAEDPEEVKEATKEDTPIAEKHPMPDPSIEQQDQEGIHKVKDYIHSIVEKMGVEDATVYVSREGKKVQYDIETEDAGLIIGRHGKVLNALQTLAQIQLHQEADSKLFAKVDAENYRDRRKKTIEQLAKRTADKVNQTNRPVILEPMPAHERKQIHRYLNAHSNVQTHSEGKEPHRYLVVEPE